MSDPVPLDLSAYLQRIGFVIEPEPTVETLVGIHRLHATTIPFENLDIMAGRPIKIDLESIQTKLVKSRRGGYCFEHNLLLAAVLEKIGFDVTVLAARVRYHFRDIPPRTHILLQVIVDGYPYLADVGFGALGLLEPMPMTARVESQQSGWRYRLIEGMSGWTLQSVEGKDWLDLYSFNLEPQHPIDLEVANWFVSTHPQSRFVKFLIVQRSIGDTRFLIRKDHLIIDKLGDQKIERIIDEQHMSSILGTIFGIEVSPDLNFRRMIDRASIDSELGGV